MGGYSNPFDRPLQSELDEHQQQQAATVQASPIGNPFDEPLASEKAEAAHQAAMQSIDPATISTGPEGSNSDQQLMSEDSQRSATTGGLIAGAALPVGIAGASFLPEIAAHFGTLKKIADLAKAAGWGAFGYREARELYKEFAGKGK